MFGRKHRAPVPQRRPHPDPKVEAELLRIVSLRGMVARKEAHLESLYREVSNVNRDMRRYPDSDAHERRVDLADDLGEKVTAGEEDVQRLHDDIAKRITALSDTDLSYLPAGV